ncbi:alpha-galactosidase [Metabacillus sp. GX 13764]|uniref:alpha-galactosidase n=1 Tax=Metabacillus kandeliae TaxID=2900151 RepID=UPI001E32C0FD|nr:alpha-galactosidase [Metabacillus kandeliae]MCD7034107.1 alpha-galactosidase [Metabacillus kandeliae]
MGIFFNEEQKTFHLQGKDTSYVLQVYGDGYLAHLYWGKRLRQYRHSNTLQFVDRAFSGNPFSAKDRTFSLDTLPQEYPGYGNTDFRAPAYELQHKNGTTVTDLRYEKHEIFDGKPRLEGLPAVYTEDNQEAATLEITLKDQASGVKVILLYTVFHDRNVIARSARIINGGIDQISVLRALSANVDFRDDEFDFLQLSGAWGRERYMERNSLRPGIQSIESRRGASSHQQNPFMALLRKGAGEESGEVFGFSFVYSGSFLAQAEVDQFHNTRVSLGINPFDFSWVLESGESFQCPEAIMVHSHEGLGGMSRTYHDLYRSRLARGQYRDKERPILVNNWEATYFDFTPEKIEEIAKAGQELGIELFVLDDGWFGKRNDDKTSLGDWFVNKEKLPGGLDGLAERVNRLGLQFGLWVEPEMVSEDSELYRKHPDWCLHVPNHDRSTSRDQLVLDFSREDVCKAITEAIAGALASAPIQYVKWDMNRSMTEIGSAALPPERQRETAHRYMLGLYSVMETLTSEFPDILFESCSGGGGRFDPGILYYMPQTWTSDNTDAVSRLKIQYGTSLVYPVIAIGAHVSAVPNHQVDRITSMGTRGAAAMSGNLGYELDLTELTEQEKEKVKEQIAFYKGIRTIVQFGDFYRLKSPFEGNETAWMFVKQDKSEAVAFFFRVLAEPNAPFGRVKLHGLDEDKTYQIAETGQVYGGDELAHSGLSIPASLNGDFQSLVWRIKEQ